MGHSVREGDPSLLGATPVAGGINFAVYAGPDVQKVELCLFDHTGTKETERIALPQHNDEGVWHGIVEGIGEGALYGYRVHGPYNPAEGKRYNPNKLLVDPYAKALFGELIWDSALYAYDFDLPKDTPDRDLSFSHRDSAPFMPKCRVVDWQKLLQKSTPGSSLFDPEDAVIVEAHVKGGTILKKSLPEEIRGSYASYGHKDMIGYFTEHKRNAIEWQPIHAHADDHHLVSNGLTNYWGYMTLNYFAPHNEYAATDRPEEEIAVTAKALRDAGIELWQDVVYNHTCEGNHLGPTLSFRGFDDNYYRHPPGDARHYFDTTGCGNMLNFDHPMARKLVVDSLAYWKGMGFSGFRFDLGVALGREGADAAYNPQSTLFRMMLEDPRLANIRSNLTGEPWDIGRMDSYQLGNTPFVPWNDECRHAIQEFAYSKNGGDPGKLAHILSGTTKKFANPREVVNKITSHDGSTPNDLVSYEIKHNWANLEDNRDGPHEEFRQNCGVEGPTDNPDILSYRQKLQQFGEALLALTPGRLLIPLGHARGHTQLGNNNAYAQDNEQVTWVKWDEDLQAWQRNMMEFDAQLMEFRHTHPSIHRHQFFSGEIYEDTGLKDITWINCSGSEMDVSDWSFGQSFGFILGGKTGKEGEKDTPILVLINGSHQEQVFILPETAAGERWTRAVDSSYTGGRITPSNHREKEEYTVLSRSVVMFEGGIDRHLSLLAEKSCHKDL